MQLTMLTEPELRFLHARRVGHLATAAADGSPHVVPVCYAAREKDAYITIDEKPKHENVWRLKRLRNISENPRVALTVDRYDEDWSRLGFVLIAGRADILHDGTEHDEAQSRLRERYPQLLAMHIEPLPVIAIRIERVTAWGRLAPDD
ncbi:MAG: TIGR03668 family PPOX class F420-dependent oxidoreductase [Gammaproteobacteria bacterium]